MLELWRGGHKIGAVRAASLALIVGLISNCLSFWVTVKPKMVSLTNYILWINSLGVRVKIGEIDWRD